MPVLRERHDLGLGEAAHFGAHRLQGLVEAGVADRAGRRLGNQGGEPGAILHGVALRDQLSDGALL